VRKPRKLKPETRIEYLRRDLNTARAMLEVAATKFSTFAREIDQNVAGARHGLTSDMREISSECTKFAENLNGW
jgi:hypothetical protein